MNKLSFRKVFFTSAVAVAVLFSGCGSDDDDKVSGDSNITSGELGSVAAGADDGSVAVGGDDNGNGATSGGVVIGSSLAVELAANAGANYFVTNLNPNDTDSTYKKIGGIDKSKFYVFKTGTVQFTVQTNTPKDEDGDSVYNLIVEETAASGTVTNIELNVTVK